MKYLGKELGGKYRILDIIGRGGMGTVYEAEHMTLEKIFAVKILLPALAGDQDTVARFEREAKAAAKVKNEHIISVTDIDEDEDGTPYIVMELLEGESLHDLLSNEERLSAGASVDIMLQILIALNATHDKGIVHRDLKPENIFLTRFAGRSNWVKILDFGIAKFKESPGGMSLTHEGTLLGTPYYMAPEQAKKGNPIDARTDLFTCGTILCEMLTGRRPFDPQNVSGLLYEIMHTAPPHPSDVEQSIPRELGDIIMKALSKKPEDRYQSAYDMASALSAYGTGAFGLEKVTPVRKEDSAGVPTPASSTEMTGYTTADKLSTGRKKAAALTLVVLALATAAAAVWYFGRPDNEAGTAKPQQTQAAAAGAEAGQEDKQPAEEETPKAALEERIDIALSTEPADAAIYLDGAVLPGNPHKSQASPDGSLHLLEVKKDGYLKHSEWLKFEGDLEKHIVLEEEEEGTGGMNTAKSKEKPGKKSKHKKKSSIKYVDSNPYKKK